MINNEFKTKENKIWTKDKIEPQHIHQIIFFDFSIVQYGEAGGGGGGGEKLFF